MFNWSEIFLFVFLLVVMAPAVGKYMAYIFKDVPNELQFPILNKLEEGIYKLCRIDPSEEMSWQDYLSSLLIFNLFGCILLFLILISQGLLPLNPESFPNVPPVLALNVAISFVTNTDWQAYAGEATLSYLTQMIGITTQNFLSAATGNVVLLVLIRGFTRQNSTTIGNFWKDLTRTVIYLLLPFCILFSLFLISQGVIQTLAPYVTAMTLENKEQIIPLGPVASQVAINQLGTNGGGFFNANGAHPFANPSSLTNFLETFVMLLIPAAAINMFGEMTHSMKQARLVFGVMFLLWFAGLLVSLYSDYLVNPVMAVNPDFEGKETRFIDTDDNLWSISTTTSTNGSTNSNLSSLPILTGGVAMFNIMTGGVVFGGVGIGLCKMIMTIILSAFLGCLMVGKSPEYLGKKIEKREISLVMISLVVPSILILFGSSLSMIISKQLGVINSQGPHGLSEVIYMFVSTIGNNGSSFASFNFHTDFYNLLLAAGMLISRLVSLIPLVVLGGVLAAKKIGIYSIGTFATDTVLFGVYLIGVILMLVCLIFFPALTLGPLAEHLLMLSGKAL